MQRNAGASSASVTALRASLRAAAGGQDMPKPPKARKQKRGETEEERAIKAEKAAMAQHTTSLLKGDTSKKAYLRPAERAQRAEERKGGLFWQLLAVVGIAGGVAYALDPTLVPAEWTDKAYEFVGQYIKI
jgi:hypothetical protein